MDPSSTTLDGFGIEHPNAAGVDIGSRSIWVSVDPLRDETHVREFATTTDALNRLADWLIECQVDTVAMEATGVYWVPLFEILEARGIRPCLVNAHHVKTVPGRKSDVLDCQWLHRLHCCGLLRSSFRPDAEIVELRQYLRHRHSMIRRAADHVRRIQKTLILMNLQLHNVVSDIMGKTGLTILRAIIAGERNPQVLAAMSDYRCRRSPEEIAAALTGNYKPEQIFTLRQEMQQWDLAQHLICECDLAAADTIDRLNKGLVAGTTPTQRSLPLEGAQASRRVTRATVDFASRAHALVGVNLTRIPGISDYTAAVIISEIGTSMDRWPTSGHFASWLRLVPRQDLTGGRIRNRHTMPGISRLGEVLRTAAATAGRTQTAIGAFYRRMAARKGKGIAVVATANKLARIVYGLIKSGLEYEEAGADYFEQQYQRRTLASLERRAKLVGFKLVPVEPEATQ